MLSYTNIKRNTGVSTGLLCGVGCVSYREIFMSVRYAQPCQRHSHWLQLPIPRAVSFWNTLSFTLCFSHSTAAWWVDILKSQSISACKARSYIEACVLINFHLSSLSTFSALVLVSIWEMSRKRRQVYLMHWTILYTL